jgi:predicted Ser/Thr protein kinase
MNPRSDRFGGGLAIEAWTVHCPDCSAVVDVEDGATAVACPKCSTVFRPGGMPTVAGPTQAAPPSDPTDSLVGTSLGRWRLERLIGKGGMGRVYEARDPKDGRRVALKVLPAELADDASFVGRFHRESKLLAELSHPHIVEVYDGGEDAGRLWFAMEYVRGETLRRRIERGPLPPEEAARIAAEVASALTYAHARRVVHRDLKPENVLLDEQGRVRLADFGLSRLVKTDPAQATTHLTRTDVILGTYEYMAPEQRRGSSDVDGRADLYSLGVILYEMLTGTLPFGRFSPASQVAKGVSPALDAVINRALAPERDARFPDAVAFREAVLAAGTSRTPRAVARVREPEPEPVVTQDLEEARGILKHVDILAGLDRALGVILLVVCFAGIPLSSIVGLRFLVKFLAISWVVVLVSAIIFLRLGRRLSDMSWHSRESQITASIVLLFFPPFLTAMGIYGLLTMTTERARRAFAIGRKRLMGPRPVVAERATVVVASREPVRTGPGPFLRLLLFGSILWTIYVAIAAGTSGIEDHGGAFVASCVAFVVSLVVAVVSFAVRHRRRGFGIAVTAAALFLASVSMLWDRAADHVFPFRHSPRVEIFR